MPELNAESSAPFQNNLDELTDILARGCLRLYLTKKDNEHHNPLKRLDSSRIPSDQLDRELTTFDKGRKS